MHIKRNNEREEVKGSYHTIEIRVLIKFLFQTSENKQDAPDNYTGTRDLS